MIGSNFDALMNPGALTTTPNPNVGMAVPGLSNRPAWAPQGVYAGGLKGFGQHLSDALREPGMAHALMRGAAASFEGKGIGGSLDAINGSMDQTHGTQRQQAQQDTENALADRLQALRELTQQQQHDLGEQGIDVDRGRLAETTRSNMAGEGLQKRGQDVNASVTMRGQDVDERNNVRSSNASMSNAATGANASMFGSKLDYLAATDPSVLDARRPAGIGSKAQQPSFQWTVPSQGGGWFSSTPKTPSYKVKSPTPPTATGAPGGPEVRYGPDGKAYVKDPATGKPVPYTGG